MELTVDWTEFARDKLSDIFEYHKLTANVRIARKLVDSIVDHTIRLSRHPKIGQFEEFLQNRPEGFRYLIHKNYKIVYWINERNKRIEIVHVFDTRQDPVKIREVK